MFSAVSGNVGIGTSSPQSKLHIDETASTSFSVIQIDFDNNPGFQTRGTGIKIEATPLTVKGTQIGIQAETSKTGGTDAQRGSAKGFLAHASGFFLRGVFLGVQGLAIPNALDNFNNAQRSLGLGGFFVAKPDSTLTLDNTGTYWVGGAYGEVAGTIDRPAEAATPSLGAVAGIIGVDNANGSAESYAGYFQGRVRVTELPLDNNLNSVVVADTNGVLHTRNANTLGGADNDWSGAGTGQMFTTNLNDKVGIGTSNPTTRLEVATSGNEVASLIGEPNGGLFRLQIAPGSGSATTRIGVLFGSFGNGLRIGNNGQGPLHFETGSTSFGTDPFRRMTITHSGNVGIGTQTPQSKLQVNGYVQLDLTSGTPPAADCDQTSEMGRMKVDSSGGGSLFVCTIIGTGIGWVAK